MGDPSGRGSGGRLDPALLREYDIRGRVGENLGPEQARLIGQAFGSVIAKAGGTTICVGRDGRVSSPELEEALVEGLVQAGLLVHRVGLGPTPMLYFAARQLATAGAVMVTGSHNPPDINGFKFMRGRRPFFGKDLTMLARIVAAEAFIHAGGGKAVDAPVQAAYLRRLCDDWDGGARALTVVWDCGNGAAGGVLAGLISSLPGHHIVLNGNVDGRFPAHPPDPSDPSNMEELQAAVVGEGAHVGIAFDGDADRIAVVDDRGRIALGDQVLALLAEPVLSSHPGAPVIADVKASDMLFKRIAELGGQPVMYRAGHAPIKAHMAKIGAILAGETNGHIFFADRYYGYDDGLYAAVRLLGLMASWHEDDSLSARLDRLPQMLNTPELRFACPEAAKSKVMRLLSAHLMREGADVCDIDGVRVSREDGWWLLRPSNTEAALVARCEAHSAAGLRRLREDLAENLRAVGAPVPDGLI